MEIFLIAIALAMDSFALSIASGSLDKKMSFKKALYIASVFALFQALMPFLGYIFGGFVGQYLLSFQKYIAFVILFGIGIKFIFESKDVSEKSIDLRFYHLFIGGFITSIDAFGVGITFGFKSISISEACIIIGLVCLVLCLVGVYIGKKLGAVFKDKALMLGGIILMGIGLKILLGG